MSGKAKILVTSAGGKTGLQVARQLLQKEIPVRALMRVEDSRSDSLRRLGADVMIGNAYDIADLEKAMAGVQRAYHCAPTAPNGLYFGAAFAAIAEQARLEHVVFLGQWLSAPDHCSQFTREVWLNEALLGLLSRTTVTTVNVGWFADNYFMVLEPAAQLGLLPMPLGDGDVPKNAPPSNEDIAAVATACLLDPSRHDGKTYRPTGPELLSPNRIAELMGEALGRKVSYQDMSEHMFLKALAALKPPNYSEAALTQLRHYTEDYRQGAFAVGGPTSVVEELTGRPAEDFLSISLRMAAERPEAKRTLARRIKAMAAFARILATPAPDAEAIERRKDYVRPTAANYAMESAPWRQSHMPPTERQFSLAG